MTAERYDVLVRDSTARTPRTIRRNRGGDLTTTRPAPWRCVAATDDGLRAIDLEMSAASDPGAEAAIAARSALPADEAARYESEVAG